MTSDFETRVAEALARHRPRRETDAGGRAAAVLIPVVAAPEPTLVFTVRTNDMPSHKGQISFPGGRLHEGETAADAALRESEEEVGLERARVRLLGELDTFPTYVTGFVVTPFVGWVDGPARLRPNPAEVAEILEVPLADLVDDIRREPGFAHGGRTFPTEAWVWNDHVIWGVTARVLRLFLHVLADAGLAARPGGTPWWDVDELRRRRGEHGGVPASPA
ncbi:MAG TPA: CoA pyrophosphatase [Actinomycetota bacterium]|nr:CoA pyrophosphatase [Actinomycetota bacterium]